MANELRTRTVKIELTRSDPETRTVEASLSSEYPVERGNWKEILVHREDSVDLSRAADDGLPLLFNHDHSKPIGVIENVRIEAGRLRGRLRFGFSSLATEIWEDVRHRILRSISIGYEIQEFENEKENVRVTKWAVLEASVVGVAADATVGINRSYPMTKTDEREIYEIPEEERTAEQQRIYDIENIVAIGQRYGRQEDAARFIKEERSLTEFQQFVMDTVPAQAPIRQWHAEEGEMHRAIQNNGFSLHRLIAHLADPKMGVDAGFELELCKEAAQRSGKKTDGAIVPFEAFSAPSTRTLTVGTSTAGGHLVSTDLLANNFIDLIRARTIVMQSNPMILQGLQGNVAIPRQTATATAGWIVADGTDALSESDPAFDQITLEPKTVGAITKFSRLLMLQANPSIEQTVRNDLAATIAQAIDTQALTGDGTGNKPLGIENQSGINSATYTNGATPDFADIVGMEGLIAADSADVSSMRYVTTPALMTALKTTDKGTDTGMYVWEAGSENSAGRMNGYQAFATANLTAGSVIFGNFSDLVIGFWNQFEILVDPYTDFAKGSVRIRVLADLDVAVRHPESFCLLTEAAP